MVESLLKKTKNLSAQNLHGNTLLHLYVIASRSEDRYDYNFLETIVKNTNHINTPNAKGNTPIFEVTSNDLLVYIKCLPKSDRDLQPSSSEFINAIISYGANVNVLNNEGESPLHIATNHGRFTDFKKAKGYYRLSIFSQK
jgi:ankyrin repeat protein